jgi:hypothetical protein
MQGAISVLMAAGGRVRDWRGPVDRQVMAWPLVGAAGANGSAAPGDARPSPQLAPPATAGPTPLAPTLLEPHGFQGFDSRLRPSPPPRRPMALASRGSDPRP